MSIPPRTRKALQCNDAWHKVVGAADRLRLLRSLTDINKIRVAEALTVLKEVQASSKRRTYQVFLNDVLLKAGPCAVLLSAVALGQNNVATMNKSQRSALVQKLGRQDEPLLSDITLKLLAEQHHIPNTVEDLHAVIHDEFHQHRQQSSHPANRRLGIKPCNSSMQISQNTTPSIGSCDKAELNTTKFMSRKGLVSAESTHGQDCDLQISEGRRKQQMPSAGGNMTSGTTIPLTTEAVNVILSHIKDGRGGGLTISFPPPQLRLPFITVPHDICADIIRRINTNEPL